MSGFTLVIIPSMDMVIRVGFVAFEASLADPEISNLPCSLILAVFAVGIGTFTLEPSHQHFSDEATLINGQSGVTPRLHGEFVFPPDDQQRGLIPYFYHLDIVFFHFHILLLVF